MTADLELDEIELKKSEVPLEDAKNSLPETSEKKEELENGRAVPPGLEKDGRVDGSEVLLTGGGGVSWKLVVKIPPCAM